MVSKLTCKMETFSLCMLDRFLCTEKSETSEQAPPPPGPPLRAQSPLNRAVREQCLLMTPRSE